MPFFDAPLPLRRFRLVRLLAPAALAALTAAACGSGGGTPAEPAPGAGPPPLAGPTVRPPVPEFDLSVYRELSPDGGRAVNPRASFQDLWRDAIPPVYDPEIVDAEDAGLSPRELVMGIEINGEARAYPVGVMREREIANDELGGVPIVATW